MLRPQKENRSLKILQDTLIKEFEPFGVYDYKLSNK